MAELYCPVTRKIGVCGGTCGTAVPVSVVDATFAVAMGNTHSNCVADKPVAITVKVCVSSPAFVAAELDRPEIDTRVPGVNVFIAWNVITLEVIENEVIVATCNPKAVPESVVAVTSGCPNAH